MWGDYSDYNIISLEMWKPVCCVPFLFYKRGERFCKLHPKQAMSFKMQQSLFFKTAYCLRIPAISDFVSRNSIVSRKNVLHL